jgi:outer membrane receptor protein involved in Fe transport
VRFSANAANRPQANGSLTYFKVGWGGSHSFKVGGEFQHEQQKFSTTAFGPSNVVLYINNNVPTQVDAYLVPNATRSVGRSKSAFISDTWRLNSRLTLNLGYRFDQYTNYVPEQLGPQGHQFAQITGPKGICLRPIGIRVSLTDDRSPEGATDNAGSPFALANLGNPTEQQLHSL